MKHIKEVKWSINDKRQLSKYQLTGVNSVNTVSETLGYDVKDLQDFAVWKFEELIGKQRKPNHAEKLELMQDYLNGFTPRQADAAKEIGISHSTLKTWLKEIGFSSKEQRYVTRQAEKPQYDNERIKSTFPLLTKAWI